jgi:hypothetical protein
MEVRRPRHVYMRECAVCAVCTYIMALCINHLMYFMFPKIVCVLLRPKFCAFYASYGWFVFILLEFCKFLQPCRHFTLKMDCDI